MKKSIGKEIRDLYSRIRAGLCGDVDRLEKTFSDTFGPDNGGRVERYRKGLEKKYILILSITLLLLIISVIASAAGSRSISEIKRPDPGEEDIMIPVHVTASYKGVRSDRIMEIQLKKRNMTDKEKEAKLDECEAYLNNLFTRNEEGVMVADGNTDLPDDYCRGLVDIEWTSSDPVLIDEKGNVDVIALSGSSETVILTADISCDSFCRTVELKILVKNDPDMYRDSMIARMGEFISHINDDTSEDTVLFPAELDDGINLSWQRRKRAWGTLIVFSGAALVLMVYSGRYRKALVMTRLYRQSVKDAFPSVIDKLILLLNSGLTVFSALMRISEDYERNIRVSATPLGSEAAGIGMRVRNTNSDIVSEWQQLAARMGSGDMMRFSALLADNMSTGSDLAEKLEAESENLREMRRKNIRKKIQLVDSRMIVPMMLMLFSLILITVAPAMLSFG